MRMRTLRPGEKSKVTEKDLLAMAKHLQVGLISQRVKKQSMPDDMVTGLRFYFWQNGTITMHVQYNVAGGDKRPLTKIGTLNKDTDDHMSLEDARHYTKTIKALGDRGIDVEKANWKRLLVELKRDGTDWRPTPNEPPKTKLKTRPGFQAAE